MSPTKSRNLLVETANNGSQADEAELRFQQLKVTIHEKLVDSLDLSMLAQTHDEALRAEIEGVASEIVTEEAPQLTGDALDRMVKDLADEVFGMGPLEKLLDDASVSDILVNGPHEIFVERHGRIEKTDVLFADDPHLVRIIQRVVSRVGRRIDEISPMVDARLPDGSRINAVLPPLAIDSPTLSVRRFGARPLTADDLIENSTLTSSMVDFLAAAVSARVSILFSGGTGAGKTTFLNAAAEFIPGDERLVTIEDSAELQLHHNHVVRLETRPTNSENAGEVTQRDLVRNSLRMRPDRIIVGEVRGAEALDMLQAMNTGHEGSMTTIHANDTRDALARLEMMVAMSGFELPVNVVRKYIANGITLVVQLARLKGGARHVMRISEIVGMDEGDLALEDIFGFEQTGVDDAGVAHGEFYATGYRPDCLSRLQAAGFGLPTDMFEAARVPVTV
jgi:pilus assembly protein CpaF